MLDDSFTIYEDSFPDYRQEIGWTRFQYKMWRYLEDPSFSVVSKIFASFSIFFVVLSIFAYILESHPFFHIEQEQEEGENPNDHDESSLNFIEKFNSSQNSSSEYDYNYSAADEIFNLSHVSHVVWWLSSLTLICCSWFTFEYLIRFIFCPSKKSFLKSIYNNLDLLVLAALFLESFAIVFADILPRNKFIKILIPLRFARIVRLFKLMKHYRAFQVLVYTIKVSVKELFLMIIFLMIGVVIFACLVYYVEPETFDNIPIGCWWALVTMTTVCV